MRRVITTLAILLVVVVAGMTALVLLVNPNDFRAYMVQQVEQRSGYRLEVHGDLRWHVWPQLSILAGHMSLTAPGASQPVVAAENMRLDVNLWPLLSHQLSVSQVMLKNAIVRVTPDSAVRRSENAPVGPRSTEPTSSSNGWSFDIGQLQLADSLLIWQQPGGDEINFRDFNLELSQDRHQKANLDLSTRVSRNQRNLVVHLKGQLDAAQYPHRLAGQIDELNYTLTGVNLAPQGISGTLSLKGDWDGDRQQFNVPTMALTANDSSLSGTVQGSLSTPQHLALDLHATTLNLDTLMQGAPQPDENGQQHATVAHSPVIAEPRTRDNADSPLNMLDAELNLSADSATWRGLNLTDLQLNAQNQEGLVTLNTLRGKFGEGSFSIPGRVDIRQPVTEVALQPELQQVAILPLLEAFGLPKVMQGNISLKGDLSGQTLNLDEAKKQWQGTADISATQLTLAQLNLQQMVRRAVARASNRVSSDDSDDAALQEVSGHIALNKGVLNFSDLNGSSSHLQLNGAGNVDMTQQTLDMMMGLKLSGWKGDDRLVKLLSDHAIPFHIFGAWNNVQYSLPVEQVLRQQLQNEAKSRLNEWLDRQPQKNDDENINKLLRP